MLVRLNNRVDWKFSGYLISDGVLINEGDGKSKEYVSVQKQPPEVFCKKRCS